MYQFSAHTEEKWLTAMSLQPVKQSLLISPKRMKRICARVRHVFLCVSAQCPKHTAKVGI